MRRRYALNSLKVDGQIICCCKHLTHQETIYQATRPHGSFAEHRKWYHSGITFVVVIRQENDECSACTTKEPDNGGAVPGESVATILNSEQQLDCSRRKDCKANEIEFCRECVNDRQDFGLGRLPRDVDKKERRRNEATDRKVKVKA